MTKREMPDLESTKFSGRYHYQRCKELHRQIRGIIRRILELPGIKGITQREEYIRRYEYCIPKHDNSTLPYLADGIGTYSNNKFECISAELSHLIMMYWRFVDEKSDTILESVTDGMEYLDHLCKDPKTIKVASLGNCKYRITNDRIRNGFRMVEDTKDADDSGLF